MLWRQVSHFSFFCFSIIFQLTFFLQFVHKFFSRLDVIDANLTIQFSLISKSLNSFRDVVEASFSLLFLLFLHHLMASILHAVCVQILFSIGYRRCESHKSVLPHLHRSCFLHFVPKSFLFLISASNSLSFASVSSSSFLSFYLAYCTEFLFLFHMFHRYCLIIHSSLFFMSYFLRSVQKYVDLSDVLSFIFLMSPFLHFL